MLTNSLVQQSLRRLASRNPSIFRVNNNAILRLSAPAAIASGNYISYRPATTGAPKISHDEASSILAKQRLHRPVAPHLTIYKPQVTWVASGLNRITGVALSGGMYVFGLVYLVSPLIGWHVGSASLAAGFAAWPIAAKVLAKVVVALPFTFHSFNGLRHLVWDMGLAFKNEDVIRTGWTVIGISVATALGLALL